MPDIERHISLVKNADLLMSRLPASVSYDLVQVGLIGLITLRQFDASQGVLFETSRRRRVRGALFDELRWPTGCPARRASRPSNRKKPFRLEQTQRRRASRKLPRHWA